VPRMVFGRALLLGDAAFVPRPHTAASTDFELNLNSEIELNILDQEFHRFPVFIGLDSLFTFSFGQVHWTRRRRRD